LLIPLATVSVVALAEAVALVFVLARQPAPVVATGAPTSPPAPTASAPAPPDTSRAPAAPPPRGKSGQRVASGGFGITVEKVLHEPLTYKDMTKIGPDERYVALLVAADNASGGNAQLFPAQFRLQDADATSRYLLSAGHDRGGGRSRDASEQHQEQEEGMHRSSFRRSFDWSLILESG